MVSENAAHGRWVGLRCAGTCGALGTRLSWMLAHHPFGPQERSKAYTLVRSRQQRGDDWPHDPGQAERACELEAGSGQLLRP